VDRGGGRGAWSDFLFYPQPFGDWILVGSPRVAASGLGDIDERTLARQSNEGGMDQDLFAWRNSPLLI
jgi:hypothetical protein